MLRYSKMLWLLLAIHHYCQPFRAPICWSWQRKRREPNKNKTPPPLQSPEINRNVSKHLLDTFFMFSQYLVWLVNNPGTQNIFHIFRLLKVFIQNISFFGQSQPLQKIYIKCYGFDFIVKNAGAGFKFNSHNILKCTRIILLFSDNIVCSFRINIMFSPYFEIKRK